MEHTEARLYPGKEALSSSSSKDLQDNPAFRFFGKRLFIDQSLPEFLNELLLILFSPKRIADSSHEIIEGYFPSRDLLTTSGGPRIEYAPSARLNLKLFAFFGASRLDARHKAHRDHFEYLQNLLDECINTEYESDKHAIIHDLENLLLGLRSTGEGRTWCSQQFLPICKNLLTSETIWEATKGKNTTTWDEALPFFSNNKYIFMAHGGDVLYYQLCLALSKDKKDITEWNRKEESLGFNAEEADPKSLHEALDKAFKSLLEKDTGPLNTLTKLINALDPETTAKTDPDRSEKPHYQSMGWCAADSWREGYLFAVELLRILRADVDIMDRLTLLETACGLQILRTLAARTAELYDSSLPWPGYLLPITALEESNFTLRTVSQHACKYLRTMQERLILDQLPNCTFEPKRKKGENQAASDAAKKKYLGNDVSKRYVSGLYSSMAKNYLGLIVPRTGSGERFVLSERILRLLVLTLVPAQGHLTLDRFKARVRTWHGFVFDADGFEEAQHWLSGRAAIFPTRCDAWLRDMLEDGNFLIHLSDACSLVHNPIMERQEA